MRWIGLLTFTSILMGNTMAFGETITFAREVAPIIYSQCVSCHRDGEVGPFPLLTYEQVKKQSEQIAAVVEQRIMPPWKAKRTLTGKASPEGTGAQTRPSKWARAAELGPRPSSV